MGNRDTIEKLSLISRYTNKKSFLCTAHSFPEAEHEVSLSTRGANVASITIHAGEFTDGSFCLRSQEGAAITVYRPDRELNETRRQRKEDSPLYLFAPSTMTFPIGKTLSDVVTVETNFWDLNEFRYCANTATSSLILRNICEMWRTRFSSNAARRWGSDSLKRSKSSRDRV